MATDDLSTDSPVEDILRAVGSRRGSFSPRFVREFNRFRAAVSQPGLEATATPFWAAFEAVSWAPPERSSSHAPRLRLALTVRIPGPVIECLVAGATPGASDRGWRIRRLDQEIEGCDGRLVGPDDEAPLQYLLAGGDFYNEIALGHLKTLIGQGCIPFGSSESHPWISRRSIPMAGAAWLVVRDDLAGVLSDRLPDVATTQHRPYREPLEHTSDWQILGPLRGGLAIRELAHEEPFNSLDAFRSTFHGSRLQIQNAIRLPDGVLFLSPCLPKVACAGADKLLVDVDEPSALSRFELLADGEGVWRFPSNAPELVGSPGRFTIRALENQGFVDAQVVSVVRSCSLLERAMALTPGHYGADTKIGQLGDIDHMLDGPKEDRVGSPSTPGLLRPEISLAVGQSAKTAKKPPYSPVVSWEPIGSVPAAWWDILEACLALTNLRSRGLSWEELVSVTRDGLSISEPDQAQLVAESLVQNCFIRRLASLKSRGADFLGRPPVLSVRGDDVRVVGLLGRLRLTQLRNWAKRNRKELEVARLGQFEAIGAIRVSPSGLEDARQLGSILGIHSCTVEARERLAAPEVILSSRSPRIRLEDGAPEVVRWSGDRQHQITGLSMETRRFAREPNTYVLLRGERPVWGTQSYAWAKLVFDRFVFYRSWRWDHMGTLFLPSAAPGVFGERVVFQERGVCGSTWRDGGSSQWAYPFASETRALEWIGSWVVRRREETARSLRHWARSYGIREQADRNADILLRRYSD